VSDGGSAIASARRKPGAGRRGDPSSAIRGSSRCHQGPSPAISASNEDTVKVTSSMSSLLGAGADAQAL
jgi:hypothetical protein